MPFETDFTIDPVVLSMTLVIVLGFLIVYFVLLVRALVEMIRLDAPTVMIVFTYISLVPAPPLVILGILNLIVWHMVRGDLNEARGA